MATKHKHKFPSRAAAEAAYEDADAQRHLQYRLNLALLLSEVHWLRKAKPYRVGVFDIDSPAGPKFVWIFEPKDQRASLEVFWLENVRVRQTMYENFLDWASDESKAGIACMDELNKFCLRNKLPQH